MGRKLVLFIFSIYIPLFAIKRSPHQVMLYNMQSIWVANVWHVAQMAQTTGVCSTHLGTEVREPFSLFAALNTGSAQLASHHSENSSLVMYYSLGLMVGSLAPPGIWHENTKSLYLLCCHYLWEKMFFYLLLQLQNHRSGTQGAAFLWESHCNTFIFSFSHPLLVSVSVCRREGSERD